MREEELLKTAVKKFVQSKPFQDIKSEILTINTLVKAQYLCTINLATQAGFNRNLLSKVANGLSQHENASAFLETLDQTPKNYCLSCGMSKEDYNSMQTGLYKVSQLPDDVLVHPIRQMINTRSH